MLRTAMDGSVLIEILGGTLLMGSQEGEGSDDERPRRLVMLSTFLIGKYEMPDDRCRAGCLS